MTTTTGSSASDPDAPPGGYYASLITAYRGPRTGFPISYDSARCYLSHIATARRLLRDDFDKTILLGEADFDAAIHQVGKARGMPPGFRRNIVTALKAYRQYLTSRDRQT